MPAPKKPATHPALTLDLPGAPATAHVLPGIPGVYRSDRATPVGGIGEASVQQAESYDADPGCPLKLVQIPASTLTQLREDASNDRRAERGPTEE